MADEKSFNAVRLMRELRDRVTRELDGLTFEEQRRHMHEQIAAAQKQSPPSVPAGETSPADETRKTA